MDESNNTKIWFARDAIRGVLDEEKSDGKDGEGVGEVTQSGSAQQSPANPEGRSRPATQGSATRRVAADYDTVPGQKALCHRTIPAAWRSSLTVLLVALVAIFWPAVASPLKVGFNPAVPLPQKFNLSPASTSRAAPACCTRSRPPEGATATANLAQDVVEALEAAHRPQRRDEPDLAAAGQHADRNPDAAVRRQPGETRSGRRNWTQPATSSTATNVRVSDATDAIEGKNGKTPADLDKLAAGSPERKKILDDMKAACAQMQAGRRRSNDVRRRRRRRGALRTSSSRTWPPPTSPSPTVEEKLALRDSQVALAAAGRAGGQLEELPRPRPALAAYRAAKERLNAIAKYRRLAGKRRRPQAAAPRLGRAGVPHPPRPHRPRPGHRRLPTPGRSGSRRRGRRSTRATSSSGSRSRTPTSSSGQSVHYNDRSYVLASIQPEDSLDRNSGDWALEGRLPDQRPDAA